MQQIYIHNDMHKYMHIANMCTNIYHRTACRSNTAENRNQHATVC